jgi:hypothetical protein
MVRNVNHIRHLSSFKNGVTFQSYYSKNKTKMVVTIQLIVKLYSRKGTKSQRK